jgi:CRISPR type I-D-associated protein Csc1
MSVDIVEVEINPLDQFYYVSREAGETFAVREYIMHTALYYALHLLPSRFRVTEHIPSYQEHFEASDLASDLYIHPAVPTDRTSGSYTTRRFAVKSDEFRQRAEQENKNLKETGHQRFIDPETRFRTFMIADDRGMELVDRLPPYIRVGKKMTTARVRTRIHEGESEEGRFELGQPVGKSDVSQDEYDVLGDVTMESMAPVNVLTSGDLSGPHVSITPSFGPGNDETVSLPTEAKFLGIQQ